MRVRRFLLSSVIVDYATSNADKDRYRRQSGDCPRTDKTSGYRLPARLKSCVYKDLRFDLPNG